MDPATATIDGVRGLFQSCLPRGLALRSVTRVRSTDLRYNWNVTYTHTSDEFPNPEKFERRAARRLFQALRPEGLDVASLLTEEDCNSVVRWLVIYRLRRAVTLRDYLPKATMRTKPVPKPTVTQSPPDAEHSDDDANTWTTVQKKKTRTARPHPSSTDLTKFDYIVKTNDGTKLKKLGDIKENDIVQKIFLCGKDQTRKYTGKTRIYSGSPLLAFIKSSAINPPPVPKPKYSAVEFDYSNITKARIKEKIKLNLSTIREYLACTQIGLRRKSKRNLTGLGSSPVMQRKLLLLSEGLPVDEELMKEYLDFGMSLGITSSDLLSELEQRHDEIAQAETVRRNATPMFLC